MNYTLKDFDYYLPKNLIAQEPAKPRDHSRLLLLNKRTGKIEHKRFYDIVDYFKKGDVLVLNNSKVFPARLIGKKIKTSGKIEVFLHKKIKDNLWQCLVGGRVKENLEIEFNKKLTCKIRQPAEKNNQDGTRDVEFNLGFTEMMKVVEKIGKVPLPPYIKKSGNDKKNYQTIYANKEKIGSVAAPTAGFHFTPRLFRKLKNKGVEIEYITLHVGLGTFAPVKTENIKEHKMHAEFVEVKKDVMQKIIKAKKEKRKIIAVGTTSVRTLESFSNKLKFETNIFIYPGYKFKIVDAMITNFHLPKSTLLMLVSAFAKKENIDKAYQEAIKNKYRFYSYGDAMFIY